MDLGTFEWKKNGLIFSRSLGGEDLYKALKMLGQGHGIHGLEEVLSLKFAEIYWILLAHVGSLKSITHGENTGRKCLP